MKIDTCVRIFAVLALTALIVSLFGLVRVLMPVLAIAAPLSAPVRSGADTSERLVQATPNVLEVPPSGKPIQEVDTLLRVELDSLQFLEGGKKVAISLSFINKTSDHLYLRLSKPKQTFAADDQGNVYRYESSSGIGQRDELLCPANGRTTASFILSISEEKDRQGWLFSVDSELFLRTARQMRPIKLSFRKITPQNQRQRQQIPYSEGGTLEAPSSPR